SLLLKSDGSVFAWGSSANIAPVRVDVGAGSVTAIAAGASIGASHNLVAKSDGTVLAWGTNTNGQLGDGTLFSRATALPVSGLGLLSPVVAVAAGGSHSLALTFDGTVWAWGLNANGQLGDTTTTQRTTPVQVNGFGPGSGVIAIAAGASFSLALKSDG